MVNIYACDQQVVRCLIVPTDNKVRADLPVVIKSGSTILATTTTDSSGMITASYYYPSIDTYHPVIHCGNNTQEIYDTDVQIIPCSLIVQSDKDILSYSDNDSALITALLTEDVNDTPLSDREVSFVFKQTFDDSVIKTLTATTNSSGIATVSYSSQGIGDISIVAKVGSLVSETYEVEDCVKYDSTTYENTSSSARVIDLNYGNLPSSYTVTFEDYYSSVVGGYLILGYDDNHRVTFGIIENSTYEMIVNNNVAWASATKLFTNETMVTGQWKEQTLTVENGTVTFKNVNSSSTSQINLDKLWRCVVNNGAKIRNIKIKPL